MSRTELIFILKITWHFLFYVAHPKEYIYTFSFKLMYIRQHLSNSRKKRPTLFFAWKIFMKNVLFPSCRQKKNVALLYSPSLIIINSNLCKTFESFFFVHFRFYTIKLSRDEFRVELVQYIPCALSSVIPHQVLKDNKIFATKWSG